MKIDSHLTPQKLRPQVTRLFELSAQKIDSVHRTWDPAAGTPVFTVKGRYTSRGWTEWTQGFQFGMAFLQFDATGEERFLQLGREQTVKFMASHVSHVGVHDHGFNNVSTYGNWRRLMLEGRIPYQQDELNFCELALKASGAVQAARWSPIEPASVPASWAEAHRKLAVRPAGYVYSFNGPHSLFSDTIRSMRALVVAHTLGHALMGENDRRIDLLERALQHAAATAAFNVYYGRGRDAYDVRGRVVHESIFNRNDGRYRCPSSQQGFSPFTTWTRGAAWVICGFAEQLEFISTLKNAALAPFGGRAAVEAMLLETARATADHFIDGYTARDGIPYWDDGAPQLYRLGEYQRQPADPYNDWEPVDSSAAAISAQGLLRLGQWLSAKGRDTEADRYLRAGLTVAATLFAEPYLSTDPKHQGLLLHSVYHRPNGWDHVPKGRKVPCGESSLWGDYHAMELALLIQRLADGDEYPTFF
jgi:unsaturated chondroitin disaccharide hydrolase